MGNIKIVEYDDSYAKSIAHMWTMSVNNWGGASVTQTEQSIIDEHKNSDNINTFLAIDGDEVVGYCSFGDYKEDEGALYIPLLNARPDYHGKKVGKMLVLRAVERTIELGWPRLDLYTWAGNTKAVPLYKKCGFFWEKRDDTTHLMNFIPTVLKTEAVMDYFQDIDWYVDSLRPIEIKPDGQEEFDYGNYEYLWEKNGKKLRMEFERRGRGLRLIETDDYLFEVKVEDQKLIFGNEYNVTYHVVNKTGKPLDIEIKGYDNKNVKFAIDKAITVKSEETITGTFQVDKIDEEQSHRRTHPTVASKVMINGKSAEFKLGIVPQFPAKIKMASPDKEKYSGSEDKCYIDIENNFSNDTTFEFTLPKSTDIDFLENNFSISMKSKERKSIAVPYILKNPCVYSTKINIKVKTEEKSFDFERKVSGVFKGRTGKFGGETEESWVICNGKYTFALNKFNNSIDINSFTKRDFEVFLLSPKLGMPLSGEFSKRKPYDVKYLIDGEEIILKAYYKSSDFKDIELVSISALSPQGIIKHHYEVNNHSDRETENDMNVNCNFFYSLRDTLIPYEDKIICNQGTYSSNVDFWDSDKIAENWLFTQGENRTRGVSWPKEGNLTFNGWHMVLSNDLGKIKGNGTVSTKPLLISLDSFEDHQEFRNFVLGKEVEDNLDVVDKFQVSINNGNPFVRNEIKVELKNHHKTDFNGKISISSEKESFKEASKEFAKDEGIREAEFLMDDNGDVGLDMLKVNVDFKEIEYQRESVIFNLGDGDVIKKVIKEEGMDVFTVDNGAIQMKAAPEFANCIYSLTYKGHDWLDSSFPTPEPKSWWNPWTGGIILTPRKMQMASVLNEVREGKFVELEDNYGNLWHGIKLNMKVSKHEKMKGLEMNQYYVTLPGLPAVYMFNEINQNTGHYFDGEKFYHDIFIKTEKDIEDNWVISKDSKGDFIKYRGGNSFELPDNHIAMFGGKEAIDRLIMYHTGKIPLEAYTNNLVMGGATTTCISCESGSKVITKPTILLFNDEYIEEKHLESLRNIKFEI